MSELIEYTIILSAKEKPILNLFGTFAVLKKGAAKTNEANRISIKTNSSNCPSATS
jgi:hypothetical protein